MSGATSNQNHYTQRESESNTLPVALIPESLHIGGASTLCAPHPERSGQPAKFKVRLSCVKLV